MDTLRQIYVRLNPVFGELLYYWNDEVNSIVKEEIEHMLIMGIAVIKTHYYQETFIAMSKWLIEKCGYTTNEAKNIVLKCERNYKTLYKLCDYDKEV